MMNSIWKWAYAFLWCLLLLAATFPCIFLNYSFSFLNVPESETVQGISGAYMFAIVMIVVVHLLDIVYTVYLNRLSYKKMKTSFIQTLISIMLIAISLIFVCTLDSYFGRIFCFMLFWAVFFAFKIICIQMTDYREEKKVEKLNRRALLL
jgi:hypothetical protein